MHTVGDIPPDAFTVAVQNRFPKPIQLGAECHRVASVNYRRMADRTGNGGYRLMNRKNSEPRSLGGTGVHDLCHHRPSRRKFFDHGQS